MHHTKTSFLLSGVYLSVELLLMGICVSAKNFLMAGVIVVFFCLEIFRTYRKTNFITKGHLTHDEKARRDSLHKARSNYYHYYNIWYRFADASEQRIYFTKISPSRQKNPPQIVHM